MRCQAQQGQAQQGHVVGGAQKLMATAGQQSTGRAGLTASVLIVLTMAARLGAVVTIGDPQHPSWEYGNIAWHLNTGHGFAIRLNHIFPPKVAPSMKTRWMMPFYPYVLAWTKAVSPDSYVPLYVVQSLLAGFAAFLVFRLGAASYGTRAALFSTALFCIYPSFVYACVIPHPMCWEITAVPLALLASRSYLARRSIASLAGCAAATLWAIYIRSAWVVLIPIVIVLLSLGSGGWRPCLRSAVLFCSLVAVGVSPWAARNWVEFGSPALTSIDFPLWEGHNSLGNPTGYDASGRKVASVRVFHPELYAQMDAVKGEGESVVLGVLREAALKEIRERPLLNLVVLPAKRIFYYTLWEPFHPKTGNWLLYRLPYLAILVPGVLGLSLSWRDRGTSLRFGFHSVLGVWLAGCATVALFHYLPRFRMPAELMLMFPGGYCADRALSWVSRRINRGQVRNAANGSR